MVVDVKAVTAVDNDDTIWITDSVNFENDEVFSTTDTSVTIKYGFANPYKVANRSYLYTATSNYLDEPAPTGLRINMGAYGGRKRGHPEHCLPWRSRGRRPGCRRYRPV
jgi:hypothetical protein